MDLLQGSSDCSDSCSRALGTVALSTFSRKRWSGGLQWRNSVQRYELLSACFGISLSRDNLSKISRTMLFTLECNVSSLMYSTSCDYRSAAVGSYMFAVELPRP